MASLLVTQNAIRHIINTVPSAPVCTKVSIVADPEFGGQPHSRFGPEGIVRTPPEVRPVQFMHSGTPTFRHRTPTLLSTDGSNHTAVIKASRFVENLLAIAT